MIAKPPLRIGILGAARVASYAMIGAARDCPGGGVVVQAVAARDPDRARAYAAHHEITKIYSEYASLITADDIDAVYVALPPNLHAHWSTAAAEAGKAVLCEKPFALSMSDAKAMVAAEARTGCLIMEGQHTHYHPLSAAMREMVQSGRLGAITHVKAWFDAPVAKDAGEIRYIRDTGGGAVWDLGVYPLYWVRSALGVDPVVVSATQVLAVGGADVATRAALRTDSGTEISISCNMDATFSSGIEFTGTNGILRITNPLAPHAPDHGHSFTWEIDGVLGQQQFAGPSTFALQLAAFRDAVQLNASVPTRGTDSLATMQLMCDIDAIAVKS